VHRAPEAGRVIADGEAHSCNVLVVDDDDDIRDTLREVLEDEGYVVATASNGQQAMQYLAAAGLPVVMLLDLMMPVKNGWMVLAELAAQPLLAARVRVVIVSAAGREKTKLLSELVDAVVEKPVDLAALMATLRRLVGPAVTSGPAG
jgi:CheY-like chemotaxis protein